MKFLRFLIIILTAGFIFSSCQKEFSNEAGNARGSLKSDATGDCAPITVKGTFKKDTVLKTTNYADIQVNITQTGTYYIKTDTVNGYSFSAAGAVAVTGTNTIRLLASGKPIAPGVDMFTVKYDTSQCTFDVTVTGTSGGGGGGGGTAVYTLGGSPGTCTGATISGTYTQGVPMTASNTALVNVIVTQAGSYTLSTGAVNGVTFSASSSFSSAGPNQILLAASGIPTVSGAFTYPISSGTSNCDFSVTYAMGAPPATYTIDCTGATPSGTFVAGTPTTSSDKVTISATSNGMGSYNISTNTVNGVSFAGGGSFPGAVTQPADLIATGTPSMAGTFQYTATAATGGSTCTFSVTFTGGGGGVPTGFLRASINGAPVTTFNVNITVDTTPFLGAPNIDVSGDNNGTGIESFGFGVTSPAGITTGTPYSVNSMSAFVNGDYTDAAGNSFSAINNGTTTQPNPFTVTFSIKTATHIVGTFSGQLQDAGGGAATIAITNGQFDITF